MTRKRISDLLREEAQNKPSEPSTPDEIAKKLTTQSKTIPSSSSSTLATPIASAIPEVPSDTPATPAPLIAKVEELTLALEVAAQKAIALEAELTDSKNQILVLNSELDKAKKQTKELDEQKKLVNKLYSELNKENPLQAELDEQKKLVTTLYAEIEALKGKPEEPASPTAIAAPPPTKPTSLAKLPVRPTFRHIVRPVGKNLPGQSESKGLSDEAIGWFD